MAQKIMTENYDRKLSAKIITQKSQDFQKYFVFKKGGLGGGCGTFEFLTSCPHINSLIIKIMPPIIKPLPLHTII